MTRIVEKVADRLLGVFAPAVTAKADLCSCTGSGWYWGEACDAGGWYWRWRCNGCHWVRSCDKRYH
jgi:hypothetical protein